MRYVAILAAAVTLIGSSISFSEESLGAAAAREKEKKKGKAAGKVITEADLGRAGRGTVNITQDPNSTTPAVAEGSGAVPADGAKPAKKEKTADELRAEAETEWRKRRDKKNEQIAALQATVSRLEGQRIYADPTAQADLAKARQDLANAKGELVALDDERRRSGYRE
jgi:hypothetical protein